MAVAKPREAAVQERIVDCHECPKDRSSASAAGHGFRSVLLACVTAEDFSTAADTAMRHGYDDGLCKAVDGAICNQGYIQAVLASCLMVAHHGIVARCEFRRWAGESCRVRGQVRRRPDRYRMFPVTDRGGARRGNPARAHDMTRARLHRAMAALALLAMLLLTVVPTLSRLQAPAMTGAENAALLMPMHAGMGSMAMPERAHPGVPALPEGMNPDCQYCPLLTAMTIVVVVLVSAFLRLAPAIVPARRDAPRRSFEYPRGLGSRGPPVHL